MRISELAERTGVPPRLLRHYEARGLLTPARDSRGWRVYDEADRRRVEQVRTLVGAGIPTALALRVLGGGEPDAALLDEIEAFYRVVDARARCVARNRDALAGWLADHGVAADTPVATGT